MAGKVCVTWHLSPITVSVHFTMTATAVIVVVLLSALSHYSSLAFTPSSSRVARTPIPVVDVYYTSQRQQQRSSSSACNAKRKKNINSSENQWYEDVDDDASPEDVFWDEMERRRLLSRSGVVGDNISSLDAGPSPIDMLSMMDDSTTTSTSTTTSVSSTIVAQASSSLGGGFGFTDNFIGPGSNTAMSTKNPGLTIAEVRSAEAVLAAYSAYTVPDNYLYDDDDDDYERSNKISLRNNKSLWEGDELSLDEENAELNRQLDELEREFMGDGVDGSVVGGSSPFFDPTLSDEPWDRYGQSKKVDTEDVDDIDENGKKSVFHKELERKMKMVSQNAKEFLLDYEEDHPEEAEAEAQQEEEEYTKSLSYISITSPRLENAAVNPKAEAYFQRKPDERQGYDVMWVSAVDTPCVKNLYGVFSDWGVQFADNFADWDEGSVEGGDAYRSIEDIASYKARKVYEVTGLPCIASRTSFEVEPIRPEDMDSGSASATALVGAGGKRVRPSPKSPRVTTGYRFNNIGEHVERIVQSLLPFSEPTRVTRYRSCLCYYDGEMELFEYGELDCDLYFSGSMRTFLPMSAAINSMLNSLELALDLQFQKWLKAKVNDISTGSVDYSDASLKLRDRVLKEAKVLPNDIIDVSSFMDALVDVDLMDLCGKELAKRFATVRPSKILTIATTGLVVAIRKYFLN